jgi:hypothetical protein
MTNSKSHIREGLKAGSPVRNGNLKGSRTSRNTHWQLFQMVKESQIERRNEQFAQATLGKQCWKTQKPVTYFVAAFERHVQNGLASTEG